MGYIVGGVFILAVAALVLFPGVRKKLRVLAEGFLNIFVSDLAKTPEGARAVYAQAIEEAQDRYNKAKNTLNKFSGELEILRVNIDKLNSKLREAEKNCEAMVRAGKMDKARVFSDQRREILEELESKNRYLQQLEPRVAEAQGVFEMAEKQLVKLKKEANIVVEEMQMNDSMKSMLDELDELKRETATQKMLGAVRDGAEDLRKEVAGGMVTHMAKTSTQVTLAEKEARAYASDEYLASLVSKYQSRPAIEAGGTVLDMSEVDEKAKAKSKRQY